MGFSRFVANCRQAISKCCGRTADHEQRYFFGPETESSDAVDPPSEQTRLNVVRSAATVMGRFIQQKKRQGWKEDTNDEWMIMILYTGSGPEAKDGKTIVLAGPFDRRIDGSAAFGAYEYRPLSAWDVWLLRLQRFRMNPFDKLPS